MSCAFSFAWPTRATFPRPRAFGITQPTASKTIASLEERLGAQLLRRSSRGLGLTDAGQSFYEGAVEIVASVDDVESRVGSGEASPSSVVRVALSPAFGRMCIVPHMPQFSARFPDVCVEFAVAQRYINLIEEGIDVAIRIGPLDDSTQIARRIGSTQYRTVASPAYIARAGEPSTVEALADHDCIALMSRDTVRAWPFVGPAGAIEHMPEGPVRSNDAEYVRAAVIAGLGIGHNAGWLYARDLEEGRLVPILDAFQPPSFPINAVWPGSRRLPGRTRAFIEFIAERFAADPLLRIR